MTKKFRNGIPELIQTGIGGNSVEFRPIPAHSALTQFPEFRDGIRSCPDEITYQHNIKDVGEEDGVIPVSDSGIGTSVRNQWESVRIGRNSVEFRNWNQFQEFRNRWEFLGISSDCVQFLAGSIPGIPFGNRMQPRRISVDHSNMN